MDWGQLLTGLVGAGIGTAIVEATVTLYGSFKTNRGYAKFLAFRIAVQLEEFAQSCSNRLDEISNNMSSSGAMGSLYDRLPAFPAYPEDAEGWRNVSPEVMHLAYQVRVKYDSAQEGLRFVSHEFGFDEAALECATYCANVGLEAARVARGIRQQYGFPALGAQLEEKLEASSS